MWSDRKWLITRNPNLPELLISLSLNEPLNLSWPASQWRVLLSTQLLKSKTKKSSLILSSRAVPTVWHGSNSKTSPIYSLLLVSAAPMHCISPLPFAYAYWHCFPTGLTASTKHSHQEELFKITEVKLLSLKTSNGYLSYLWGEKRERI